MRIVSCAAMAALLASPATVQAGEYEIPLFFSADDLNYESFVNLRVERRDVGPIEIVGYDDEGNEHGPVELTVPRFNNWALTFVSVLTSGDIENGNTEKGLSAGLGDGVGDWRLVFRVDDGNPVSWEPPQVEITIRSYAGRKTSNLFVPIDQSRPSPTDFFVIGKHSQWCCPTHHSIPTLPHPYDTDRTAIIRIFNRQDHYVRVYIKSDLTAGKTTCEIPPHASLTKTGRELYDLMKPHFGSLYDGQLWELEVREVIIPDDHEPTAYCGPLKSGGSRRTDGHSIGVMAIFKDVDGNLADLISSDPRNMLSETTLVKPHRSVAGSAFQITPRYYGSYKKDEDGEGTISIREFTQTWRDAAEYSIARWEQVITTDYTGGRIPFGIGILDVDDLLIRFLWGDCGPRVSACAAPDYSTAIPGEDGFSLGRPKSGRVIFDPKYWNEEGVQRHTLADSTMIHEIGHVLGIGIGSAWLELVNDDDPARPYFTGSRAIAEFKRLYPVQYRRSVENGYSGVPLVSDAQDEVRGTRGALAHWDGEYVTTDVMAYFAKEDQLTRVTLGALEDLGYDVDKVMADVVDRTYEEYQQREGQVSTVFPALSIREMR